MLWGFYLIASDRSYWITRERARKRERERTRAMFGRLYTPCKKGDATLFVKPLFSVGECASEKGSVPFNPFNLFEQNGNSQQLPTTRPLQDCLSRINS